MKNRIYNVIQTCFLVFAVCFYWEVVCLIRLIWILIKFKKKELDKDNLWGSYLTTMQRRVVSEDVNLFQRSEDLFGNMYSGYFCRNAKLGRRSEWNDLCYF